MTEIKIPKTKPHPKPGPPIERLTLNVRIYHHHEHDIKEVSCNCEQFLKESEEPWQRNLTIGEDWVRIDTSWIGDKAGYISIENKEGKNLPINPSLEEKEDIAKRIIEIAYDDNHKPAQLILPGFPFFGLMTNPNNVWVRCQHGQAKIRLTVFPK